MAPKSPHSKENLGRELERWVSLVSLGWHSINILLWKSSYLQQTRILTHLFPFKSSIFGLVVTSLWQVLREWKIRTVDCLHNQEGASFHLNAHCIHAKNQFLDICTTTVFTNKNLPPSKTNSMMSAKCSRLPISTRMTRTIMFLLEWLYWWKH